MRQPRRYHEPPRHYRGRQYHPRRGWSPGVSLLGIGLLAAILGGGWAVATPKQKDTALRAAERFTIDTGAVRARAPQEGDYWRGCDDARAAGTAPIYRGEPGYREGMDGDNDGIACEPYH
ncbi:excalibur calcium-binding domain-containing protein [Sphingopyxis indica]|uniref:excalibur calcium-binding domain-containing protein n=1 Tax=Sphingopyxis indica TaxID=436663 RepID=UPI0029390A3F|nr:excalibur calcium-binding domain-containing protein [Sphingopyxis indica]WOF42535.1 excalibur calcium-binding domain-containing protein [Sphingopyxis indica]